MLELEEPDLVKRMRRRKLPPVFQVQGALYCCDPVPELELLDDAGYFLIDIFLDPWSPRAEKEEWLVRLKELQHQHPRNHEITNQLTHVLRLYELTIE